MLNHVQRLGGVSLLIVMLGDLVYPILPWPMMQYTRTYLRSVMLDIAELMYAGSTFGRLKYY